MIRKASFFKIIYRTSNSLKLPLQLLLPLILLLLLFTNCTKPDTFHYSTIYRGPSIEGLSARALVVLNDAVIVAGPGGVFGGRFFGGDLVEQPAIEGAEDIRDMHIFNDGTMVLMNSGEKGIIYRIDFMGKQSVVFDSAGVFLDGMDFWDDLNGICYGDPVGGQFFLLRTFDGGKTWFNLTPISLPLILNNEAGFAASGTGIQCIEDSTVYFVTGMADTARMYCSNDRGENWIVKNTPLKSGGGYGIYSTYFWNKNEGMIIGGSWEEIDYKKKICYYTSDGGTTWENRSKGLEGYMSCIQGNADGTFLATTGDKGTFYSLNKGETWGLVCDRNYYSLAVNKSYLVLIGREGTLEVLLYKY